MRLPHTAPLAPLISLQECAIIDSRDHNIAAVPGDIAICFAPPGIRVGVIVAASRHSVIPNIAVGTAYLFPIWVGPPYQELSGACSLLWPFVSPAAAAEVPALSPLTY